MGYSIKTKQAVIKKALLGEKTHTEIAKEAGIGRSTLAYWLKNYKCDGNIVLKKQEKRPQDWTSEERIESLIETGSMSDEERVAWCRTKGIFVHHLKLWKKDIITAVSPDIGKKKANETGKLKKEILSLKKELSRKDKALAETAALLVLKKKPTLSGGTQRTIDFRRRQNTGFRFDI